MGREREREKNTEFLTRYFHMECDRFNSLLLPSIVTMKAKVPAALGMGSKGPSSTRDFRFLKLAIIIWNF